MKISDFINQVSQHFKYKRKYYTAVICLILGITIALKTLFLLQPVGENINSSTSKDTLYVNILNGYAGNVNQDTALQKNTQSNTSRQSGLDTIATAQGGELPEIHSDSLLTGKAYPIGAEQEKSRLKVAAKVFNNWAIIIVIGITILFITLYSNYKYLPFISEKINQDKDPQELTEAFNDLAKEITELGNPRKIKRFSNKVRFQYYYLRSKQVINNKNSLNNLLKALLAIENRNDDFNVIKSSTTIIKNDNELLSYFLEINKEDNSI
jgi:hypothetical protein